MIITFDPVIFTQNSFTNLDIRTYWLLKISFMLKISFNKTEDSYAVH